MKYTLSIIVVNYNAGDLLGKCIEAVVKTTNNFTDPKCEIIIVDNDSSDRSIEKLKSKILKVKTTTKNLKLIRNDRNLGFSKAVNKGISGRQGEYVLLLNPDTVVRDGSIKRMLEFASAREDVGVVGARLLNPDASIQSSVFHFPSIFTAMSEFWFGIKDAHLKYVPVGDEPSLVDALVGAAFLITPQALKKAGVLDEKYFMYFEDLDYCRKVKGVGLKVYYLPQAEVIHYHGVSGRTLVPKEEQWKRLIPSSRKYHGFIKHYIIHFILWTGQKMRRIFR